MASIQKRRKGWDVVYRYKTEDGSSKQKWERFNSYDDALKRKHEVEYQQDTGTFIPPSNITVRELLEKFMQIYGIKTWSFRTYTGYESKIRNYINPHIGDLAVKDVNALTLDTFYHKLQKTEAVGRKFEKSTYMVTPHIVKEIHKCLRCAFNQAIAWEIITKNPCTHAKPPKYTPKEKALWESDDILFAIQKSEDLNLTVCLHLAFACTMRIILSSIAISIRQ